MLGIFFILWGCSTAGGGTIDSKLVGSWRILSETIYYDAGGQTSIVPPSTKLRIKSNGTWSFGPSKGTCSTAPISAADWTKWGIESYGPTQKITLNNWNKARGDGPIEKTEKNIDYLWVIYHETFKGFGKGTVWIKFGASP